MDKGKHRQYSANINSKIPFDEPAQTNNNCNPKFFQIVQQNAKNVTKRMLVWPEKNAH